MRTLLLAILLCTCALAQAQHRGEIILDGLPPDAVVTVVTPAGDVPNVRYERQLGQTVARWITSSDCVVVAIEPPGVYNYTLRLADTLTDEGTLTRLLYTCPPEGGFTVTPPPPCDNHVYPNPTFGPLYSDCGGRWTVYSMSGRMVRLRSKSIDLSGLPAGEYILRRGRFKTIITKQ